MTPLTRPRGAPAAALFALLALLLLATPAAAHVDLVEASPADGTRLVEPPSAVVLTFSGELDADSGFVVTAPGGAPVARGELDLAVADRNVLRADLASDAAGAYVVSWTVVGLDGHEQAGLVTFVVGTQPLANTAMAAPDPSSPAPAVVAGGIVGTVALAVAAVIGIRRERAR